MDNWGYNPSQLKIRTFTDPMILWASGAPIYFPLLWLLLLTTRIFLEIASWVSWKQNFTLSLKGFSETLVTSWVEIHAKIHQIGWMTLLSQQKQRLRKQEEKTFGFTCKLTNSTIDAIPRHVFFPLLFGKMKTSTFLARGSRSSNFWGVCTNDIHHHTRSG